MQVKLIDGGWRHSMAATATAVYAWGWNKFGQLGIGQSKDICTPTRVTLPSGEGTSVVHLSCGWKHTLLVTGKGDFYTMGRGTNGQLGLAVHSDMCALRPMRLLSSLFAYGHGCHARSHDWARSHGLSALWPWYTTSPSIDFVVTSAAVS
jgi:alpha-tubulin suppressor-like RCC1 family protein